MAENLALKMLSMPGVPGGDADLLTHFGVNLKDNALSQVCQVALHGKKPGQALKDGGMGAVIDTAGSYGAKSIGDLKQKGKIGAFGHKALHFVNGFMQGALRKPKDFLNGGLNGGVACALSPIVTDNLPDCWSVETRGHLGTLVPVVFSMATGQNAGDAHDLAKMTVENNFDTHVSAPLAQKLSLEEFVDVHLEVWEKKHGTLTPQQKKIMIRKFERGYYTFRSMHLSKSLVNPGHDRLEEQFCHTSYESFRAARLSEIPPERLQTKRALAAFEKSAQNHYAFYQGKKVEFAVAPLFGFFGGGVRILRGQRFSKPPQVIEPKRGSRSFKALNVETGGKKSPQKFLPKPMETVKVPTIRALKVPQQRAISHQKSSLPKAGNPKHSQAPPVKAKSRVKSAPVDAQGKWPQKQGKAWREKIVGKGQRTGTDGHAFRSNREAVKAAKREDVEVVAIDQGVNRLLPNSSKTKPNRRPDVAYKTTDGKIHQIEVPSKTDNPEKLIQRMERTKSQLPKDMRGSVKIKFINKE